MSTNLQVTCNINYARAGYSCYSTCRREIIFLRCFRLVILSVSQCSVCIMSLSPEQARAVLLKAKLRVTAPRIAVLSVLAEAESPLSHTEVLERLTESEWDPATIYRSLVKLKEAGVAPVVSRLEGISRYAYTQDENSHQHPHFVCDDCGKVECLPAELTSQLNVVGSWSASIKQAVIQLSGECPDCLSE